MRVVLQRVKRASVTIEGRVTGEIERGFMILAAIGAGDTEEDLQYIADRIIHLRVFEDDAGKMNRSLVDIGGAMLVISQFTLYADCRKGRRPGFTDAAPPEQASRDFARFLDILRASGLQVETGRFGAMMDVDLLNSGPVTILMDSREMRSVSRRGNPLKEAVE